jgi:hypothetical protein
LLFVDIEPQVSAMRDPVAPVKRSAAALAKAGTHSLDDETPAHSFSALIAEMATIARNTCRTPGVAESGPSFTVHTSGHAKQIHSLELIR